jgi:hypothetical protein
LVRPKGAPWTILCLEIQGADRVSRAERIAEMLKRTNGIRPKDVWVADEPDGFARLYYGVYHRRLEPGTLRRTIPRELREDLTLIHDLGLGAGQYAFRGARMTPLPRPDVGNPDWALVNAKGVYTLQVAVFEPTDDFWEFKQAAADYCAYLREQGFEAYYHHAANSSMVTVGAWGPEALVTPPNAMPHYSREVRTLQENELMKYNLVNGAVVKTVVREDGSGGAPLSVPVASRLVHIPRRELRQP